jgi:hypothetical protein
MQSIYARYRNLKKEIRQSAVIEIQRVSRGFIARCLISQLRLRHRSKALNASDSVVVFYSEMLQTRGQSNDRLFQDSNVVRGSYEGSDLGIRDMENDSPTMMAMSREKSPVIGIDDDANRPIPMELTTIPPISTSSSTANLPFGNDVLSLSTTLDANTLASIGRSARGSSVGAGNGVQSVSSARPLTPGVTPARTSAGLYSSTAINAQVVLPQSTGDAPGSTSTEMYARYKELLYEKRELKKVLKKFDEEFAQKHGRQPVKAEKEVGICYFHGWVFFILRMFMYRLCDQCIRATTC